MLLAAAASRAALSRLKKRYFSYQSARHLRHRRIYTHSVGVVVGWPESFSVLGVVTSSETVLTSVVQVGDTIGDEWVSVGIVDLLLVSTCV